jgi:hypothetical protein
MKWGESISLFSLDSSGYRYRVAWKEEVWVESFQHLTNETGV